MSLLFRVWGFRGFGWRIKGELGPTCTLGWGFGVKVEGLGFRVWV